MTQEVKEETEAPRSKWQCTVCRATIEILIGPPLVQNSFYPAESGPYAERQTVHSCPVRNGLLPKALRDHPNTARLE